MSGPLKQPTTRGIWLFVFILSAILVSIPVAGYLVLDRRGKSAWAAFVKDARARGEWIEPHTLIPPPVPDEENFAAAPMFAPLFDYTKTPPISGNAIWGNPSGRTDLLSVNLEGGKARKFGSWLRGIPTDLGEWQTDAVKPNDLTKSPAEDVLTALSRFDRTMAAVRAAALRPRSRFPVHYDELPPADSHCLAIEHLAEIAILRASAELSLGRTDDACADAELSLRLARTLDGEPALLDAILEAALVRMALQPVWEGLVTHQWNDAHLKALDAQLSQFNLAACIERGLLGEREFHCFPLLDFVKQDRRVFRAMLEDDREEWYNRTKWSNRIWTNSLPDGWIDEKKAIAGKFFRRWLDCIDPKTVRFFPKKVEYAIGEEDRMLRNRELLPVTAASLGYPREIVLRSATSQAFAQLARLALELERHRVVHGIYPERLTDLLDLEPAGFTVPVDPASGHPAHYRLDPHGGYILYYDGWNEMDDGGKTVWKDAWKEPLERTNIDWGAGDWVWPKMRWK